MSVEFCDTNIIVYAYDPESGDKHDHAKQLLDRLWESFDGALSIQVLQELYVTLTRKLRPPILGDTARAIIQNLLTWRVIEPGASDVLVAIDMAGRWQISFWDAMLLTAARKAGASVLWSEDLNDGQVYDGVVVRNPFRGSP
jgi:predicted nucleic acid-binding protein